LPLNNLESGILKLRKMAVLASILPVVSRSSALALELYRVAAEEPEAAKELIEVAGKINGFALILKQVGTIIKEDDRLPSPEVRLGFIQHCKYDMAVRKSKVPASLGSKQSQRLGTSFSFLRVTG
jgi:hypothetical protein